MTPEVFTTLQLQTVDLMKMLILFSPVWPGADRCILPTFPTRWQRFCWTESSWRLGKNCGSSCAWTMDRVTQQAAFLWGQCLRCGEGNWKRQPAAFLFVHRVGSLSISQHAAAQHVSAFPRLWFHTSPSFSGSHQDCTEVSEIRTLIFIDHWSNRWTMLNYVELLTSQYLSYFVGSYCWLIPRTLLSLLEPGSFSWQRWLWWTCWWPAQVCQAISVWYSQRRSKLLKLRNLSNPLSLYLDTTLNMIVRLLQ